MKQITMKVTSYVTFTTKEDNIDVNKIPVKMDVFYKTEDEDSIVVEVVESEVINKVIQTEVEI